jgi:hypothetical protein
MRKFCVIYIIIINLFNSYNVTSITINNYKKKLFQYSNILQIISFSTLSSNPVYGKLYTDEYFQIQYPDKFNISPKPIKTHEKEFLSASESLKGYNFGLTVISNIQ